MRQSYEVKNDDLGQQWLNTVKFIYNLKVLQGLYLFTWRVVKKLLRIIGSLRYWHSR